MENQTANSSEGHKMLDRWKMLVLFAGLIAVAGGTPCAAATETAPIFLTCDGFNSKLNGTIRHIVEIGATRVTVDGNPYSLTKNDDSYILVGPMSDRNILVKDLLTAPTRFIINRLDGSYLVLTNVGSEPQGDWSRPQDNGCAVARQKF